MVHRHAYFQLKLTAFENDDSKQAQNAAIKEAYVRGSNVRINTARREVFSKYY